MPNEFADKEKVWVDFQREKSDGIQTKIWVDGRVLNFRNNKARRMIEPDRRYLIEWFMKGNAHDTLSISRTALGEEKNLVENSKIASGSSEHRDFVTDVIEEPDTTE